MSHNYNAGGTQPSSGGASDPVPAGAYRLKVSDVKEGKSKGGDYQVVVTFRVVGGEYDKRRIPFHYVTFFKDTESPGAGISLAFLKAMGQPYKDKFTIDPEAWRGKEVLADVTADEYQGRLNNKVQNVESTDAPKRDEQPAPGEDLEQVPF